MRTRLRGINRITKKLASGETVTYFYAWKGGPRLEGEPGTPEFIASYTNAVSKRAAVPREDLRTVINKFQDSSDFQSLAEKTRSDYAKHIRAIDLEFGDMPVAALSDRRIRGDFLAWRDQIGSSSRRQADYRFSVLARILSWAFDRGLVPANPCLRPGRLYRSGRADNIWTREDELAFYKSAPGHLHLALMLALWTGQRQGDLLRLTWSAYDGGSIRLRQRKTGARVVIPAGKPLKVALDDIQARLLERTQKAELLKDLPILTTLQGKAWTESGFRASWRKACTKAGIVGLTFHDLRGTAVTRLAIAGCSEAEIATITGHSLRDVGAILDVHYLKRDARLATSAISKLETSTRS